MTAADGLPPRQPQILTDRIVDKFFTRVLQEDRPIHTLTIVSPWISEWDATSSSLKKISVATQIRGIQTLVITRPPVEDWHVEALATLGESMFSKVWTIPDLHAKLFICEAEPTGFGLIGSSNLTKKSLSNVELGILFEGRGMMNQLLRDLKTLAWQDLRRFSHPYLGG